MLGTVESLSYYNVDDKQVYADVEIIWLLLIYVVSY